MIRQGDVFWADLKEPIGSEPGYRRPVVVVQNDAANRSRLATVIVCAMSSSVRLASSAGNVLLERGEANLPKRTVVNVSQILTVDKSELHEFVGTLPFDRVLEILNGIGLLLQPAS